MTNQHSKNLMVDEASLVMQSAQPRSVKFREPTVEEMDAFVIQLLATYTEVVLSAEQRAEVVKVIRTLSPSDMTLETLAAAFEQSPLLAPLAQSLREQLAKPHMLLGDPRDGSAAH
ncbi:hypothetical protein [Paraburkholderia dipogonis]|uniref:hypothetical protein n=1 Tax=Paraburkholderia dipogonis TaxID=1211383 RepID=UPI0038BA957A